MTKKAPLEHSIEVVWLDLDVGSGMHAALCEPLSLEERRRASQLATPLLRRRAEARFGWRRLVLGARLGIEPRELNYVLGDSGKPALLEPPRQLRFNASSHDATGVLVLSSTYELGVDVESINEIDDTADFAGHVATVAERQWLDAMEPGERRRGVLRVWTRKEALAKGLGQGLTSDWSRIESEPRAASGSELDPSGPFPGWHLFDLICPHDDLASCLAVRTGRGQPAPLVVVRGADPELLL